MSIQNPPLLFSRHGLGKLMNSNTVIVVFWIHASSLIPFCDSATIHMEVSFPKNHQLNPLNHIIIRSHIVYRTRFEHYNNNKSKMPSHLLKRPSWNENHASTVLVVIYYSLRASLLRRLTQRSMKHILKQRVVRMVSGLLSAYVSLQW